MLRKIVDHPLLGNLGVAEFGIISVEPVSPACERGKLRDDVGVRFGDAVHTPLHCIHATVHLFEATDHFLAEL